MKRRIVALASMLVLVTWAAESAASQVVIPFQARILEDGAELDNTTVNIDFAIYDTETGGTPLWTESHTGVSVNNGWINVRLGGPWPGRSPLDDLNHDGDTSDALDFTTPKFLGITVKDLFGGSEMVPRHILVPAFHARLSNDTEDSDLLAGKGPDAYLSHTELDAQLGDGSPARTTLDSLLATLTSLEAQLSDFQELAKVSRAGVCNGKIVRVDNTRVKLEPYNSTRLVVDVDGELFTYGGGATVGQLEFDLTADTDAFTTYDPAQAQFYYLYVWDQQSGTPPDVTHTPVPLISALPPVDGAHQNPDDATQDLAHARYVGDIYHIGGQGIAHVDHNPLAGEYRFKRLERATWPVIDLPVEWNTVYKVNDTLLDGRLPATATAALLEVVVLADDNRYYIASAEAAGSTIPSSATSQPDWEFFVVGGAAMEVMNSTRMFHTSNEVFWLPVDGGDPKFAYASWRMAANDFVRYANLTPLGWRSPR